MPRPWPGSGAWRAFLAAASAPRPLLLMLDFDGTLAAIVPRPSQARLTPALKPLLRRLASLPGVSLAVVSGRGMAQLRKKIPLPRALLVSNHGLRVSRPGLGFPTRRLAGFRREAGRARKRLAELLKEAPGLRLEDKELDLSLHWRTLSTPRRRAVEGELRRRLRGLRLQCRRGLDVLEIRPTGAWDKGRAALCLARRLSRGGACLFAGDDRTDESAFKALRGRPRSLTLKVGSGASAADMRMRRRDLPVLLKGLLKARQGGPPWN